ncbi:DNA ligase D [Paracoccus sp. TK19116]|uniref:DNA ligase (ATP) n=1 Tax=Paracoccus albicereus TaxID=2922394 RepID=A0ABT1MMT7_9RHOB|nr:DNA ligase D [Paracoccus albicereus]MCQ0969595.1 DNA ligase D [Paracoccus albicereus]
MAELGTYLDKRDFGQTPEPSEAGHPSGVGLRYSIQNHRATRLHWDLRLEWEGVLLSWAITRGPSFDPSEKRLAVRTEDHPLSYLGFEGEIPEGNYGAGTVMLWDIGWWQPLDPVARGLKKGHLHLRLHGRRMTGDWNLILMKGRKSGDDKRQNWLMIKGDDEAAGQRDPVARYKRSVSTGRTFAEIKSEAAPKTPALTGKLPRLAKPQLATLVEDLADPGAYWHELKLDGYRAMVALGKGGPRVYTRSGLDWTDKFSSLVPAFEDVSCDAALIDGEIVAGAGMQGFSALQDAIKAGGPFSFVAFDLLSLAGTDLTDKPLTERRKALEKLMKPVPPMGALQVSPVIEGDPAETFGMVCESGGEGLIAKRRDGHYRTGRGKDWLKIKCRRRAEFVIVGWQPSSSRARPFASLALAAHEGDKLTYVGKVGTGFDEAKMDEIATRMKPLARKSATVEAPASETAGVRWLSPSLVAEIDYAEITAQGRLRHAVFLDLREDKPAREVRVEREVAMSDDAEKIAGIAVSSADRVIFDKSKLTKGDVARYYEAIAPAMLEETADRPLSLLRLPEGLEGERFFQKHPGKGFPDALKIVEITEKDGDAEPYAYVTDAAGLVGAVQMGTIEFHIWGARRDRLDRPDRLVFDLDPDEGLKFAEVKSAAFDLRDRLADLGLESWAMLSGGKGIHVVVPLRRTVGWDTAKLFCRGVASLIAEAEPMRFLSEMSKAKRKNKIFIDWLRNERGSTAIAPFSLRARPGAGVAMPIAWDALGGVRKANATSTKQALEHGWQGVDRPAPQTLGASVTEALERAFAALNDHD